ncbi:MAG: beta-galactosidase [Candidatus Sumerlaeota bacterium]|nr:beta-galactosidase [Candidatus Sumerlaeota bacterium]
MSGGCLTEEQLTALEKAGMPVICDQNEFALKNKERKIIVGWMHGDEPDNAQELPNKKGYGPPILPEKIVADSQRIRQADPSRPVMLNLGQGVAWDGYYGRGVRTNKPEDYPKYIQGCDIASFDIYPVTHDRKEVKGKLEFVGKGVQRLRQWSENKKPVWACIECTRIGNPNVKPTPEQVKAIVWMALIHGAKGLIYFSHEFKPKFIEAGLLADPAMAQAAGQVNKRIQELAPVLNSATIEGAVEASSANKNAPIDIMVKRSGDALHVFAINMSDAPTSGVFTLMKAGAEELAAIEGENPRRRIAIQQSRWQDVFQGYETHHYRIGN